MPTYYSVGGICKKPAQRDKLNGWTEIFLYNPTTNLCKAKLTAYFENRAPLTFDEPVEVKGQESLLLAMPEWHPEVFTDVGFWGLKFETTSALDCILIQFIGPRDKMQEEIGFKGAVSHFIATDLHTQWHFADGLWLNWTQYFKGDLSKAPFPFNELEYYYFLNPGPQDASVDMTLQYRRLEFCTFHLKVPAGRVYAWCNLEKISYNQAYGVKAVSSHPITTTSVRYIYSLKGFEDWGINLHTGMPAEPGPIKE